jgi:hypothetical protein
VVYSREEAYRNPHCALCNNVTVDSLICLNLNQAQSLTPTEFFK